MNNISYLIRLSFLLGLSLLGPTNLPAGGGDAKDIQIRRNYQAGPILAGSNCTLRTSPFNTAPQLHTVNIGTPLQILRYFQGEDGKQWIYVQLTNYNRFASINLAKRGWVSD